MRMNRKLTVSISVLSIALAVGAVFAFNSLSITSTLNVKEPLFISFIGSGGDLAGISCSIAPDLLSATCTKDVFAGDTGSLTVTVGNSGHEAITVTPNAISSSPDATVKTPVASAVPASTLGGAGLADFMFVITVSQS